MSNATRQAPSRVAARPEPEAPLARAGGFEDRTGDLATQAGSLSNIAREEAELKAAIVLARQFPRSEAASYERLMKSCKRPSFAEGCLYSFPRGREQIVGPSVDLAREAARCWGNTRYGLRIVTQDDDWVHIKGCCFDLETNNYVEVEDKFRKLIYRRDRGWIEPDERDLRELINRRGAICVRNAILQVLPPDVIDDAVRSATETTKKAAAGEIEQDRTSAVRRMVMAFSQVSVSAAMLEQHLGHAIDLITDEEIVKLRGIFKSISDGNSKRDEYFTVPGATPTHPPMTDEKGKPKGPKSQALADKIKGNGKADAAAAPAPQPEQPTSIRHPDDGEVPVY